MIRRWVLSLIAGALFAGVLVSGQSAKALCLGYCENISGYAFAGCNIYLNARSRVEVVVCSYIGPPA